MASKRDPPAYRGELSSPLLQPPPSAPVYPHGDTGAYQNEGSHPGGEYCTPQYPQDSFPPINGSIPAAGIPAYANVASFSGRYIVLTHHHGATSAPDQVMVCPHNHIQPEYVTCGHCRNVVLPTPVREVGACTWLAAGACCLLGCWPCVCAPFCCESTKDTVFRCPSCSIELYRVKLP